ncbi:MAG: sulfotransferase [Gammaproteobacteria bacterium]
MLALVGNSPSSGSTFLADLLDSTDYSACGPELGLLCNNKIYNFDNFKLNPHIRSSISSLYTSGSRIDFSQLPCYGIGEKNFLELLKKSNSLTEFINKFAYNFLVLRNKNTEGVVFEKTPQNITCIGEFLKNFPKSYFIHVVRNPAYVYLSLKKRDFSPYIALGTWLIEVAKYVKYKSNPNVILVKYEDLVSKPYSMISDIMQRILGVDLSANEIEKSYANNKYRAIFEVKLPTWSIKQHGIIANANKSNFCVSELTWLKSLMNYKISTGYAEKFDLAKISFVDALKEFGYYDWFLEKTSSINGDEPIPISLRDKMFFIKKWLLDFKGGFAKTRDLKYYMSPLEKCE